MYTDINAVIVVKFLVTACISLACMCLSMYCTAKTESDIELGKNFRMIKYPRQPFRLPSDQYFKLDLKNMVTAFTPNNKTYFRQNYHF